MDNPKEKYSVYLSNDTYKMVDSFYKFDACTNRSLYIERAIRYYTGHVTSNKSSDYLPDEVNQSVRRSLKSFEDQLSKMLFKISVELDMLMNVVAASINVNPSELDKLRAQCVENVKRTRGQISFAEAVKYQNGDDNE